MIRLASVIETFEADFLAQYRDRLTPDHYRALAAMKQCRTQASPKMLVHCTECEHQSWCRIPAAIGTARTASIMRVSNGWNGSCRNRCPPNTFC
jgi:hypothetical protein